MFDPSKQVEIMKKIGILVGPGTSTDIMVSTSYVSENNIAIKLFAK